MNCYQKAHVSHYVGKRNNNYSCRYHAQITVDIRDHAPQYRNVPDTTHKLWYQQLITHVPDQSPASRSTLHTSDIRSTGCSGNVDNTFKLFVVIELWNCRLIQMELSWVQMELYQLRTKCSWVSFNKRSTTKCFTKVILFFTSCTDWIFQIDKGGSINFVKVENFIIGFTREFEFTTFRIQRICTLVRGERLK